MRSTIEGIASHSIAKPDNTMAGKPTEKILRLGAERDTKPNPMLTNNKVMTTGKAISKPARYISALQLIILPINACDQKDAPMGNCRNDSSKMPNTIKCPPVVINTSVDRIVNKPAITGTFPKVGSIMLAMVSPIEPETS